MSTNQIPDFQTQDSLTILLARLMWFFIGPAILFLFSVTIVTDGGGWMTATDAWFAVVAFLTVLGRWYEQRSGFATDSEGNPTTGKDCSRYIIRFLSCALVVWLVANALGNHVLEG